MKKARAEEVGGSDERGIAFASNGAMHTQSHHHVGATVHPLPVSTSIAHESQPERRHEGAGVGGFMSDSTLHTPSQASRGDLPFVTSHLRHQRDHGGQGVGGGSNVRDGAGLSLMKEDGTMLEVRSPQHGRNTNSVLLNEIAKELKSSSEVNAIRRE
eukprot:CAMPEP_0113907796 /NCGR_PEP_ID=MMETSP0780_2-20120614/25724_1 /TAXON_ID=652834 /ORGANISM="Palpitomonas bilix" /LENGTH=156 /DNA_ID=CAMNT_0000902991 /DNA_START=65 /DNA_END=535 /DNA_ORIENTATION=- /assembly_acc=CAM_ASM_000599